MDAKVQKFAIVLDTGVAELDNGDLNVGKYASSEYTGTLTNALGGTSSFSNAAVAAGEEYYSVSQVLSASFLTTTTTVNSLMRIRSMTTIITVLT